MATDKTRNLLGMMFIAVAACGCGSGESVSVQLGGDGPSAIPVGGCWCKGKPEPGEKCGDDCRCTGRVTADGNRVISFNGCPGCTQADVRVPNTPNTWTAPDGECELCSCPWSKPKPKLPSEEPNTTPAWD